MSNIAYNLQNALKQASKETSFNGCCTSGVERITRAAGLSISSGGWYKDIWSTGSGPTNTPPEKVGYKIYATGVDINNIVTSTGQPYIPSVGDIATYYGGNNPRGCWFPMPSDYRSNRKKYPSGYLYHCTTFLGDNIGWVADGHHGHLERPYKGIDCYYGVTSSGKPSTHVTVYRYDNIDGNITDFNAVSQVSANGSATGSSYGINSAQYTNGTGSFEGASWGEPKEGDVANLYKIKKSSSRLPGVIVGTHIQQL